MSQVRKSLRESAKNAILCFLLFGPIAKITNPQKLYLCGRVFSTGIKIGYFIHEIKLFIYLNKVIKLKIQPVSQSQIYVACYFLAITTMNLIKPPLPKLVIYSRRILILLFIDDINLFWYSVIKTK